MSTNLLEEGFEATLDKFEEEQKDVDIIIDKSIFPEEELVVDTSALLKAGPGEEYDYEGYMVRTQLRRMEAQASELIKLIEDDEQFPAWLQSKVTLASEYMDTVYDFYKYSDYSITSSENED